MRRRICEDFTESGIFQWLAYDKISSIFVYANPYVKLEFEMSYLGRFSEYVFPCLVMDPFVRKFAALRISKEYNVGPSDKLYMPGRFIFGDTIVGYPPSADHRLLAEQPAIAYTGSNFNVELHYLSLRKHIQPGKFE